MAALMHNVSYDGVPLRRLAISQYLCLDQKLSFVSTKLGLDIASIEIIPSPLKISWSRAFDDIHCCDSLISVSLVDDTSLVKHLQIHKPEHLRQIQSRCSLGG